MNRLFSKTQWGRYQKEAKRQDLTDWEIDDETGNLAYVIVNERNFSPDAADKISAMAAWCTKNTNDEWFWDWEEDDGYVFYFKKYNDALVFKLTWV